MNWNHVKREFRLLLDTWGDTYDRFYTDVTLKDYSDTIQQFITDFFRCLPYTLAHIFTIAMIAYGVWGLYDFFN